MKRLAFFIGIITLLCFTQQGYAAEPTVQASGFTVTATTSNSITISWTRGNGDSIIIIGAVSSVSAVPTDGQIYLANSEFGSGSTISGFPNNSYVLYKGIGTSVVITGLSSGSLHEFYGFEFDLTQNYYISSIGNHIAAYTAPAPQASDLTFSNLSTTTIRPAWTSNSGTGRIVVVHAGAPVDANPVNGTVYTADRQFMVGDEIGTGNYVVYNNTGTGMTADITALLEGTTYHFKVFNYVGSGASIVYNLSDATGNPASQATLKLTPTEQASLLTATNKSGSTADISWTGGNGENTVVYINTADSFTPPTNGTDPSANSVYGGSGQQCIYNGSASTFNVSGLLQNTTYYVRAYEYNNTGVNTLFNTDAPSGNPASFLSPYIEPVTQVTNISLTPSTTSINYSWTNGSGEGRIVKINTVNSFTEPVDGNDYSANSIYAGGEQVIYNGTGNSSSVSSLSTATTYYFRAYEYSNSGADRDYNPNTATGNPNSVTTLKFEPSTQGSNLGFSLVTDNSLTLNWTRGNGDSILILAKAGEAVTNSPSDNSFYLANAAFGSGAEIATGNFVVYRGTGTTVAITALNPTTAYHFRAFEFNNGGTNSDYNISPATGNPANTTTLASTPTTQASLITFPVIATTSVTINWTNGNGTSRIVAVREADQGTITNPADNSTYTASTDWSAKGTQLGTSGYYTVYNGSSNSVALTNLSVNTTYWVQIFEYTNGAGNESYYTATATDNPNSVTTIKAEPTTQTSLLNFSNVAINTLTLDWTRGNGDGVIILANAGSAVSQFPADGTDTYVADAAFGSGTQIGSGNYVIYKGTGTTANITALTGLTDYHFRAFEYNNSGNDINYFTNTATGNPNNTTTLGGEPTTQANAIAFSNIQSSQLTATASGGNGTNRLILAKQGSAVNGVPVDGTEYTANTIFGQGQQIGTGNYVVSAGSSTGVTVTSLSADTRYYFKVFEYNNTGSNTNYKTDGFGGTNPDDTITTKPAPTIQATNLAFTSITTSGINLTWTRGNGDSIIIVAKLGSTLTETPTDGNAYFDNANFGSGEAIGGAYVVYTGLGTTVSITGLASSTEYTFKAFEFNNGEPFTNYLTTEGTNTGSQFTVGTEPTVQANEIVFSAVQANQVTLSWTAGTGGGNRLVLAHAGSAVDSNPLDGFSYTANASFETGDEIGTGNFVVYNGAGTGETVTNLLPETTYHFKVFEYSGTGTTANYLTSDGASNNPNNTTTAIGIPNVQASNLTFANINTTAYRVGWTRGSGADVIVVGVIGSFSASENPVEGGTYTADAAFGSGSAIGSGWVVFNGNIQNFVDVTNLQANTNYTFKAFEYNTLETVEYYQVADGTNNPMSQYTLALEPTEQTSSISFSSIGSSQVTLSWSGGNGASTLILAREASDINDKPSDGKAYIESTTFALGDTVGTDHYVVYNGAGTGTTITGLNANTTYYFRAYEYNGTATSSNYLTSSGSSSNVTTIKTEPTLQANNITFTNIANTSYTVDWVRGDAVNNDGVIVVAKLGSAVDVFPADGTDTYTASSVFGSGTDLGTGNYVVYKGTGTSVAMTGLTLNNQYHFRAFEYTNSGTDINYLQTTATGNPNNSFTLDTEPTTQASAFSASPSTNGITLNWTNGDGTGRLVLARQTNAVNTLPVDGNNYTANANFGDGTVLNTDNFVVYAGTGSSIEITGLSSSTDYHFQVFEYNNTGVINYRTSDGPTATANTGEENAPSTQASGINFTTVGTTSFTINWTNGNGENRIVVMRETDQGTIQNPVDDNTYTASNDWSAKGTQLGTSGYYTVFNGSGNSVSVSNLTPNTAYYVQVFEYNNPVGQEKYNTTVAGGNQTTLKLAPTVQASNIALSNATSTSIGVSWTNGNGDSRIVVARETSVGIVNPVDNLDYTANTTFASGDATGTGNYVIYKGSSESPGTITVIGLTSGTSYTFVVYEFNNSGTNSTYYTLVTDAINSLAGSTLGIATWDGSTDTDWNTAANWSPESVPTSGQSVIIPDVTTNPVVASNNTIENLTINAGGILTINTGVTLTVSGNALLESPTGNGASGQVVIAGTGNLTVTGTSTMERYYPSTANWRLVTSPITSPQPTNWTGYYVNAYNEPTVDWSNLNSSSTVDVMQGLSVLKGSGPLLLSFSGTFNNGNTSINVTNSSPGDDNYGWNIVGNPYPSAIDWAAGTGITRTNVDAAAYLYNPASGSYDPCIDAPCVVGAGQGFFIHASANGSLSTTNSARIASDQTFRKQANLSDPYIKLIAKNQYYSSEATIRFNENATSDFDSEFDAYKLLSTNDSISDIYTLLDDETLVAINTLNSNVLNMTSENYILPLGLTKGMVGNIEIEAEQIENVPEDVFIYLFDAKEDKYINLQKNTYDLIIDSKTDDRFQLVFSKLALGIDITGTINEVLIFTNEKTLFVKSDAFELNKGNIYLFDVLGKIITSQSTSSSDVQEIQINKPGTYLVKVIVNNSIITQKVVVE